MAEGIPKLQTVALLRDVGPNARIEIRHDYPVTLPGRNEVLLKMECSGIWWVQSCPSVKPHARLLVAEHQLIIYHSVALQLFGYFHIFRKCPSL